MVTALFEYGTGRLLGTGETESAQARRCRREALKTTSRVDKVSPHNRTPAEIDQFTGQGVAVSPMTKRVFALCMALAALAGLYIARVHSYLLFHILAELFSIVIACAMFMIAWNARKFEANSYLLFIGIAYLFVGGLDLVHTLSYRGMNLFSQEGTNTAAQFWVAARYLESLSLLISPVMFNHRLRVGPVLAAYSAVFLLIILSVFYWKIFPNCFVHQTGLTPFKKNSEYLISLILLAAGILLYLYRRQQDPVVLQWLLISIGLTIASEIAFTEYARAHGPANLIGHYLKILSFYFIYKAIVETGLMQPYALLFRELKKSEEALQRAHRWLEEKVLERTADLQSTVNDLSAEVKRRVQAESMLRRLSRESIEALESDRKSVAKEVHDSIGASLAAIKFLLEEVLDKMGESDRANAEKVKRLVFYLADTIHETKRISAQLRPMTLEELGLLATIEAYARQFGDLYKDIQVQLTIEAQEAAIPDSLKIVIYRILQEALNNVGKHSRATAVQIILQADRQHIRFELADNGVGFDLHQTDIAERRLNGYGLKNMRERTEIIGGSFSMNSAPSKGTRIKAVFPKSPIIA